MVRVHTRIWPPRQPPVTPEHAHPALDRSPAPTGVCISGGSTRSFAAAVGILRGLTSSGLITKVGYLSAVSGGAWAAVPYTYYRGQASSDREMLGVYEDPAAVTVEGLEAHDQGYLGDAASASFAQALSEAGVRQREVPARVWADAVGQVFLAPFGLYAPEQPTVFTLDERTAADVHGRNPGLASRPFHTIWSSSYRPYLLVHATLSWPPEEADVVRAVRVGFEYSPLAVGTPTLTTLEPPAGPESVPVRVGGYVEPFAFGGTRPRVLSAPGRQTPYASVELPERPFTLADAVGASSAFRSHERGMATFPHVQYWAVGAPEEAERTTAHVFTDGGDLENYGLIPLLRRRVQSILVFINTIWPLSVDYDPGSWPSDRDEVTASHRPIDPFLAPLFGAAGRRFPRNHVLPARDYVDLVTDLQRAKRAGGTVMTVMTHTVQSNPWWGVEGGWDVRIGWIYNDMPRRWLDRLREPLRTLVLQGQADVPVGPFRHFPHYLTRGQNPGSLIRLTPAQVNLAAHLASWNVIENQRVLEACLDLR